MFTGPSCCCWRYSLTGLTASLSLCHASVSLCLLGFEVSCRQKYLTVGLTENSSIFIYGTILKSKFIYMKRLHSTSKEKIPM